MGFFFNSIYDIVQDSLMTRARASVPSLEQPRTYSTTWAVLYRMFLSREIYAVDDNELVIPWIPCRWDFRLHACPPQGERNASWSLALLRWSPPTISSKPVLSRSIPSQGFQLAVREFCPRSDRTINIYILRRVVQDNFPWAPINDGQIRTLFNYTKCNKRYRYIF